MKKIAIWIIASLFVVLFSGILPISNQPVWYAQYLALLFVVLGGISLFIWNFNKWLSLLLFSCLFSTFFVASLSPRSIFLLFNFNLICLASYLISQLEGKYRIWIKRAIFILFLIQLLWLLMQFFNIPLHIKIGGQTIDATFHSLLYPDKKIMVGLSGSHDQLGTFFALTIPVIYAISPIFTILSIAGLYISKSSFAFVSGVVALLFLLFFTNRKHFKVVSIMCLISSLIFFTSIDKLRMTDFSTRIKVWEYALKSLHQGKITIEVNGKTRDIKCNPLLGFGFGNFQSIFPFVPQSQGKYFNFPEEKFTHAHNDFIENHFETGYLGSGILLLLIGMFFVSFYKLRKSKEAVLYASCIVAYLFNATGNFLSQIAISGMFLCIFYGLFEGIRSELDGKITVNR